MAQLLACPFCRELFREDEGVQLCPECELQLRPLFSLPPLPEAEPDAEPIAPSDVRVPWWHWQQGRGALLLIAGLGLAAFFAPWVGMTKPELATLSGFALAKRAAPWLWAGPVAWFITVPLLLTRRTLGQLYGVRLICCLFAAMTLLDLLLLWLVPASSSRRVPVEFQFAWGFWLSGLISALGAAVALRLGGTPPKAKRATGPVEAKTEEQAPTHNDAQRLAKDATLH